MVSEWVWSWLIIVGMGLIINALLNLNTISQKCLIFLRKIWISADTLHGMRWNFIVFAFSRKSVEVFYRCAELALNLCKKCAKIFLILRFLKTAEFIFRCAELVLKLCKKCAEILLLYVFSKALKFFNGCAEFAPNLCRKSAEILLFFCFLKSAEVFLRICWLSAEILQEISWNFIVFTFSQKRWNLLTDVLNLCWNFVRNALNFFLFLHFLCISEIFLRMCWICAETL